MRVIKSRRMRWAGNVARMGEERGFIGPCWGNRRERDRWGNLGVDGWIILGRISRRWDVGIWTGLGSLRKFQNMVLRRIFGPRSDEVTGEWRRLHNEELNDCSPNIVRVIKWRRMRWAWHVACMG